MASSWLFGIALFVVTVGGLLLLFKFARKAAKWALIILAILFVASTAFGINLFNDVRDLQENFPKAQKLILLKDGNTLLTGFEGSLFGSGDIVSYLNEEKLSKLQKFYNARDIQSIRGSYFKVMIFDIPSFDSLGMVQIDGKAQQAADVLNMIKAPGALEGMVAKTIEEEKLPDTPQTRNFVERNIQAQGLSSDEDVRSYLFAQLFISAMEKDPLFLINGFKSSNMIVYPETITFKLAKMIPTDILKGAFDKLVKT